MTTQEGNALNPGEVFKRAWPMFMAAAPGGRFVEGSYAKEAVALKRLIAEAFKRAPAAPLAWLLEYLKAWRARAARDPFFRDRPEIPSTLASSGMAAQIIGDMEGRGRAGARSGIDPEAVPL